MTNSRDVRSSNIELLRILSMMLIIATHLCNHYIDVPGSIWPYTYGVIFIQLVKSITYIAVNMYVIISAYFLCTSSFKTKRIVFTWLEVLFYSLLLGIPYFLDGNTNLHNVLTIFFPIFMSEYWFATVYIGLLILSPFINLSIKAMTEKQMRVLCIVLLMLFSIIPSFIGPISRWVSFGGSCGLVWFIVLYYCSAYIRLYIPKEKICSNKYKYLVIGIILASFAAIARFIIAFITAKIFGRAIGAGYFYGNNVIFNVIATYMIFAFFSSIKFHNASICNVINILAKSSFGVYLIHESPIARKYLEIIVPEFYDLTSLLLPLQFLLIVLAIWGICTLIDFVRQILFKPLNNINYFPKLDQFVNSI